MELARQDHLLNILCGVSRWSGRRPRVGHAWHERFASDELAPRFPAVHLVPTSRAVRVNEPLVAHRPSQPCTVRPELLDTRATALLEARRRVVQGPLLWELFEELQSPDWELDLVVKEFEALPDLLVSQRHVGAGTQEQDHCWSISISSCVE